MTEESKSSSKKALSPLASALIGVVSGVLCLLFAALAHKIGMQLSETEREILIGGGGLCLVGGVVGARFMPVKS